MQEYYIDDDKTLLDFVEQIKDSEWLAIDTEFIREKTYHPNLCLLQISNGKVAACIDPITLKNLRPLLDVLYDGRIMKVFHAAKQDLEIFLKDWKEIPLPLFDTQPAASLLGLGDQVGYAKLVKQMLNVDLPKDHSRTDWSKRPLSDGQLRYALDDVVYLGQVYEKMRGMLVEKERLQWLTEDFAELASPNTYRPNPQLMWNKVKGKHQLKGQRLAILQSIAAWRETQAVERNLPRKWVIKDEVLIDIARRSPTQMAQLESIRGFEPSNIRRHGETLIKLVAEANELAKESWPSEKNISKPTTASEDAMLDLLNCALRLIAEQQQLSPTAIATRKELVKLLRKEEKAELMRGWRKTVAGDKLNQIIAGTLSLRVTDGQIVFSE